MFGNNNNNNNTNSAFSGSSTFGGSSFGQANNANAGGFGANAGGGFGSTTGFGAQPAGTNAGAAWGATGTSNPLSFGGAQTGTTGGSAWSTGGGGGGFGNTATNTASGSGSAWGASGSTGAGAFGAKPAFGNSAPGFGSATTSNTGTGFGASSGFGASASNNNTFGSANIAGTSTGAFGQAPSNMGGSAFGLGSSNAVGAFGSTNQAAGNNGTAGPPYSSTIELATNGIKEYLQTISAMPAYAAFSVDELRVQDYLQGRKPSAQSSMGYGQTTSTSAFGAPSQGATNQSGPFGAPANQPGTGFGASTGFGANNTNTTTGFGAAPSTGTGFGGGGFGAAATPAAGGFGAANTGTGFGASSNTGFGTGFGATNTAANPATNPGFGATGGGFGTNTAAGSGFGTAATGTGTGTGFGATTNTNTGFGTGFGATSAAPAATGFGGFGAATSAAPATNTTAGFGGFGAAAPKPAASGLFGGFGANTGGATTGGFGAPATSQPTGFGLGTNTAGTGTGFGTNTTLGTANTGATPTLGGGGLFGQPAPTSLGTGAAGSSLFGTGSGLGGSSMAAKPFGAASTGTGLFGSSMGTTATNTAPAGSGLFNKPATTGFSTGGGLFGSGTTTNTSAAPATNSLFGSGGLNTSSAATNQPATGLFGAGVGSSGLMATPQQATGAFGTTGVSLKAAVDQSPYGRNPLFSQSGASQLSATPVRNSSIASTATGAANGARPPISRAGATTPNGFAKKLPLTPQLRMTPRTTSRLKLRGFAAPSPLSVTSSPYHSTAASSAASSFIGGMNSSSLTASPAGAYRSNLDDLSGSFNSDVFVPRQSVKKLVVRKSLNESDSPNGSPSGLTTAVVSGSPSGSATPSILRRPHSAASPLLSRTTNQLRQTLGGGSLTSPLSAHRSRAAETPRTPRVSFDPSLESAMVPPGGSFIASLTGSVGSRTPLSQRHESVADLDPNESFLPPDTGAPSPTSKVLDDADDTGVPTMADNTPDELEYWTKPSLDQLRRLDDAALAKVDGFKCGMAGVGQVSFLRPVDLTTVPSLAEIPGTIILFDHQRCTVYPDESIKPARGQGLNVPAVISLEGCWPIDKATRQPITDRDHPKVAQHTRKLKRMPETTFIDFIPETGVWTFRVEHFSRYGLDQDGDDDDDDDDNAEAGPPGNPDNGSGNFGPGRGPGPGPKRSFEPKRAPFRPGGQIKSTRFADNTGRDWRSHLGRQVPSDLPKGPVDATTPPTPPPAARSLKPAITKTPAPLKTSRKQLNIARNQPLGVRRLSASIQGPPASHSIPIAAAMQPPSQSIPGAFPFATSSLGGGQLNTASSRLAARPGFGLADLPSSEPDFLMDTGDNKPYADDDEDDRASSVYAPDHPLDSNADSDTDMITDADLYEASPAARSVYATPMNFQSYSDMDTTPGQQPSPLAQRTQYRTGPTAGPVLDLLGRSSLKRDRIESPHEPETHRASGAIFPPNTMVTTSLLGANPTSQPTIQIPHQPVELPQVWEPTTVTEFDGQPFHPRVVDPVLSLLTGNSHLVADAGLMLGRSRRVSWGPGGLLIIGGGNFTSQLVPDAISSVTTSLVQLSIWPNNGESSLSVESIREPHEVLLRTLLSHSEIVRDDQGVPQAQLRPTLQFADLAESVKMAHLVGHPLNPDEGLMWKLGAALWDPLPALLTYSEATAVDAKVQERAHFLERRALISGWLQDAVDTAAHQETKVGLAQKNWPRAIFQMLLARRIPVATQLASRVHNYRLATLLAQIGGGNTLMQEDIAAQLNEWEASDCLPQIDHDYRRVYELLAGNVGFSHCTPPAATQTDLSSQGTPYAFHVCEGLDWKRAFAAHIWYSSKSTTVNGPAQFPAAVALYQEAVLADTDKSGKGLVAAPAPWHTAVTRAYGARVGLVKPLVTDEWNTLFHLFKLFTDTRYPLERALAPLGNSPSPFDYRTSWVLFQVLARVYHVRNFSDGSTLTKSSTAQVHGTDTADVTGPRIVSHTSDRLCASFAFQLETIGLWRWAAYVWLFVGEPQARRAGLIDLLRRCLPNEQPTGSETTLHVDQDLVAQLLEPLMPQDAVNFLVETLHIPMDWVDEALALRAFYDQQYLTATCYWIRAGRYTQAHSTLLTYLAPTAVLNEEYASLRSLLTRLDSAAVTHWSMGGQIYLDYMDIVAHFSAFYRDLVTRPNGSPKDDQAPSTQATPSSSASLAAPGPSPSASSTSSTSKPAAGGHDSELYNLRRRMQALLKQMPQLQGPTPLSYTDIPFPRRHPGGGMSLSRTSLAARHPQGLHTTFKVSQSEMTMRLQTYIHQIDRYLRIAGNASQQVGQSTRPNATAILTTVAGPSDSFSLNSSLFNADVIPGRATTSSGPSASGRRVPIPEDHRLMRLHKLSHENYRAITNSIAS